MSSREPAVGSGVVAIAADSVALPSPGGPWLVRWDTVQDEHPVGERGAERLHRQSLIRAFGIEPVDFT